MLDAPDWSPDVIKVHPISQYETMEKSDDADGASRGMIHGWCHWPDPAACVSQVQCACQDRHAAICEGHSVHFCCAQQQKFGPSRKAAVQ